MKKYNWFFNSILLAGLIFCAHQTNMVTIERFYAVIMIGNFILLWGLLFKRPFIKRLANSIDTLFDKSVINTYSKGTKIISWVTIICLASLFPLMLFVEKVIIQIALLVIVVAYAFTYVAMIIYVIVNVKGFFYNDHPIESEESTSKLIFNTTFNNQFINVSKSIVNKYNHHFIDIKNEITYSNNAPSSKKERAILEEIYLYDDIKNYVPLFVLIDNLFINRDIENNKISNSFHLLIAEMSGGNKDSIKTKFNNLKKENYLDSIVRPLIKSLHSKGTTKPINCDKYRKIAQLLLDKFNSSIFKVPSTQSDEFILLCVLYFTIFIDGNKYPKFSDKLDKSIPHELINKLKRFTL